jgi:hypothetical protein
MTTFTATLSLSAHDDVLARRLLGRAFSVPRSVSNVSAPFLVAPAASLTGDATYRVSFTVGQASEAVSLFHKVTSAFGASWGQLTQDFVVIARV